MSNAVSTRTEQTRSPNSRVSRVLPIGFTLLLGALVAVATLYGLFAGEPYRASEGVRETLPAALQGQDLLTLLTVPVLVGAARWARRGSVRAHLLWVGLVFYYLYTYVMYAFSPFTDVFLVYVAVMGLSAYGLLDGLLRLEVGAVADALSDAPRRATGWFLIAVAALFAVIWSAMIVPAIPGGLPEGRMTYDIASAVHILDLAFVLPLLGATGVMLLRGHRAGPALAAVLLVLKVVLGLALLSMSFAFMAEPAWGEVGLWAFIVAVSAGWIVAGLRRMHRVERAWLRPTLWPTDAGSPTTSR